MHDDQEVRLLNEILPNVASQLRGSLGNLHAAMRHLVPPEADGTMGQDQAIFAQSYYRMMRLVNNLSAAPMLLETTPFLTCNADLVEWLDGLCRQASPLAAQAGISLVYSCQMRSHLAAIHKEHLTRLVWNLLSNALKFTPAGGSVTVSLRVSGGQILLSVADTGCGIREDLQKTVFDRYLHPEQMDPQPHGLGLGLPLCRRIAQGHGGQLLLESREGVGTTVTAVLPDRRSADGTVRDVPFHYAGGFQPVLMELSDALPYGAFAPEHLDE